MDKTIERFGVFSNRWFTLYFLAATLSKVGSQVYRLAIPWLVLQMTGSVAAMTIMWVIETVPFIIIGPFMGVLVDRWDRRKIMLVSDLARMLLIILLPVLNALDLLGMWYLYVLGFLLTVFSLAFDLVADFGVVPQLVRPEQLNSANSANLGIGNLADLLGPAIAGALIALIGPENALYVDGVSFLLTFLVIFFLPINFNPNTAKPKGQLTVNNVLRDIKEGYTFIRKSNILGVLSFSSVLKNFATGALFTVMTFHLGSELGLSSSVVGMCYSLLGLMMVIGSFLAPRLIKKVPLGSSLMLVTWVGLVGALGLAFVGDWRLELFGYSILNLSTAMANVYTLTVRQREIPRELMGRANAVYRMILMSSFPVSAAILGWLANEFDAKTAFYAAAALMLIAAVFMMFSRIPKYREKDNQSVAKSA
ncbi:MAG: MFS transporter [Tumebacillaceae bacterium]